MAFHGQKHRTEARARQLTCFRAFLVCCWKEDTSLLGAAVLGRLGSRVQDASSGTCLAQTGNTQREGYY